MGRPLFAGHVAGFRPMKRKNILHRMIMRVILHFFSLRNRSTGLFDKGNVVAVATRQIVQSHSLLLTDNSRAAGISKFPLSKVLTCLRSSNPRGVNTKSSFSTGSMFRTIPTREKRLIITDKTEMDFFPKESQYTESWTAKLLKKKKYYSRAPPCATTSRKGYRSSRLLVFSPRLLSLLF